MKWVGKKIHAPTIVVSKERRYDVIYKIFKKKGKWKVYDVEIEGISIVKSYGLQFDQFLGKNSAKELLEKMKNKVMAPPAALQKKVDAILPGDKKG